MHDTVMRYIIDTLDHLNFQPQGKAICEIGSLDVNGSVRPLFAGCDRYVGIDVRPGRGVDVVADGAEYGESAAFDLVISVSTLEHAPNAQAIVANAVRILKPGGVFLGTCATDPWPVHGCDGGELRAGEWYRNIPKADMLDWLEACVEHPQWVTATRDGDLCWLAYNRESDRHWRRISRDDHPALTDYPLFQSSPFQSPPSPKNGCEFLRSIIPLKVDLGSGTVRHRAGFVRIDANPATEPDIVAVMPPIPLPDESCEVVYASHFLEHLCQTDVMALMAEVWRVLIPGGSAEFIVPYALSNGAFQDPTHRSFFVPESFAYYTEKYRYLKYDMETRFRMKGIKHDSYEVAVILVKEAA